MGNRYLEKMAVTIGAIDGPTIHLLSGSEEMAIRDKIKNNNTNLQSIGEKIRKSFSRGNSVSPIEMDDITKSLREEARVRSNSISFPEIKVESSFSPEDRQDIKNITAEGRSANKQFRNRMVGLTAALAGTGYMGYKYLTANKAKKNPR